MFLRELNILNYKNIREAQLGFSDKLNCFVGLNGQGKTNILDAIYLLSFAKSAYNATDSMNITHSEDMALVQGTYFVRNKKGAEKAVPERQKRLQTANRPYRTDTIGNGQSARRGIDRRW